MGVGGGGGGRTVASSLEVVRPYCIVITTTPTFAHSSSSFPLMWYGHGRTCPIGCYGPGGGGGGGGERGCNHKTQL